MLIYKQLGSDAESQFANQWGVGYAMDNASEWKDVGITAVKTALVLVRASALAPSFPGVPFRLTPSFAGRPGFAANHTVLRLGMQSSRVLRVLTPHAPRSDRPWLEQHVDFVSVQVRALHWASRLQSCA